VSYKEATHYYTCRHLNSLYYLDQETITEPVKKLCDATDAGPLVEDFSFKEFIVLLPTDKSAAPQDLDDVAWLSEKIGRSGKHNWHLVNRVNRALSSCLDASCLCDPRQEGSYSLAYSSSPI
jgi:hypothetical protein